MNTFKYQKVFLSYETVSCKYVCMYIARLILQLDSAPFSKISCH